MPALVAGTSAMAVARHAFMSRCASSSLVASTSSFVVLPSFAALRISSSRSIASTSKTSQSAPASTWRDARTQQDLPDMLEASEPNPILGKLGRRTPPAPSVGAYGLTKQEEARFAKQQSAAIMAQRRQQYHQRNVPVAQGQAGLGPGVLAPLPVLPREGSAADLEHRWQSLPVSDAGLRPATPTSARSLKVGAEEFQRQYKRLMSGVIAMNNVRQELRLGERYEKPKYKRQRLASARHRRRFAREVGLKVAAIMKAKRQGM